MLPIFIAGITLAITVLGALPFGLVNLSVLEISYQKGKAQGMKVAHGAAWVEVLYGLIALLSGSIIAKTIQDKPVFQYMSVWIPVIIGLVFLVKANKEKTEPGQHSNGFLKGMALNLLSVQVLLYWIAAMAWLNPGIYSSPNVMAWLSFALAVWCGKMGVLWLYAHYSSLILSKSGFLTRVSSM